MSKAKMQAARELIQEKRYQEARAILETIDHPTAQKWLQRLDEIAPVKKVRIRRANIIALLIMAGLIGSTLLYLEISYNQRVEAARIDAKVHLQLFCDFGTRLGRVRCEEYAQRTLNQNRQWVLDVKFCSDLYNSIMDVESFGSCLVRRNIPLPGF